MKKKLILACLLAILCMLIIGILDNHHDKTYDSDIIQNNTQIECIDNTSNEETTKISEEQQDNSDENTIVSNESNANTEKIDINNIDVVIKDESFVTQMDSVFAKVDSYVGKTMKVEGFISSINGNSFKVLRIYDMAHDDHSHEVTVGVNAVYGGQIPAENTWVEIIGTISKGIVDGREQPIINVQRLEQKFTEGQKKVYN